MTPAETIKNARRNTEEQLLKKYADMIASTCEDFYSQTGLNVTSVNFNFVSMGQVGISKTKSILSGVTIDHEEA